MLLHPHGGRLPLFIGSTGNALCGAMMMNQSKVSQALTFHRRWRPTPEV